MAPNFQERAAAGRRTRDRPRLPGQAPSAPAQTRGGRWPGAELALPAARAAGLPPAPSGAAAASEGTMGGFHPAGPGSLPPRPQRHDKKHGLRLRPGFGEGFPAGPGAFPSPGIRGGPAPPNLSSAPPSSFRRLFERGRHDPVFSEIALTRGPGQGAGRLRRPSSQAAPLMDGPRLCLLSVKVRAGNGFRDQSGTAEKTRKVRCPRSQNLPARSTSYLVSGFLP